MQQVRIVCHPQCELAESPVWDERSNVLYFVDINKCKLYRSDLAGNLQSWTLSDQTGSIALTDSHHHLVAAQKNRFVDIGISPFCESTLKTITEEPLNNRFNDGKCDANGRFWAATMDGDCLQPTGSIWSLDSTLKVQKHSSGYIVGNGFGWNNKGSRLYFTDSENRTIYYWSFNLKTGRLLGERKILSTVPKNDGLPDGLCIDTEDHIWSAHWDGGKITRYRPDGTIERILLLPVPRPTSITFGGKDLTILLVTTARYGLSQPTLEQFPLSGSILSFHCDVAGVAPARFHGIENDAE